MERKEILVVLAIIKTAYPKFYNNITVDEAERTISLWQEMFSDVEPNTLLIAIKSLISHFKYPPTIADIREEILKNSSIKLDTVDLWVEAYDMLSNGIYMTKDQFEQYSPECQKFFGNTIVLKRMATDENINIDVVRSNFYKQIEIYKERQKRDELVPNKLKMLIESTVKRLGQ